MVAIAEHSTSLSLFEGYIKTSMQTNCKVMQSKRMVTLTWKALLSICSPSFAPSKFTIICLPYKFLRVWKCLLTEVRFHAHPLAYRKLPQTLPALTEMLQKCPGHCSNCHKPFLMSCSNNSVNSSKLHTATDCCFIRITAPIQQFTFS